MIQCKMPTILLIPHKASHVIDDQLSVVDQGQSACSGVAEKLVAKATFDASDDFIHVKPSLEHAALKAQVQRSSERSPERMFT